MMLRQLILDKAGMWTSALCAVHCMIVPMLVSVSSFSSLAFLNDERIENVVLVMGAIISAWSIAPSYFRLHRRAMPGIILLLGFFLVGLSRFMINANESVLTSSGAALIAAAHFFNYRLCKKIHLP
jgi:MerC mercury resistance protein